MRGHRVEPEAARRLPATLACVSRGGLLGALPKFRRGAFVLFLLTAILSALLADQPLGRQLVLHPGALFSGEGFWQPITANFVFTEGDVGLIFGTLVVQWFLGSELEGFWGLRKYVTLVVACGIAGYLVSSVLGAFVPSVAAVPVGGATPMDLAAVAAFGVVMGKRPLRVLAVLPLTARGLAILVLLLWVLSPLARGAPWPVVVPWLVAVAGAILVTTQPWRRMRDSGKLKGRKKKRKGHLRVVRSDSKSPRLLN
jgi:membrane associated rhomboid family serine protease